jgi:hypothetical protein
MKEWMKKGIKPRNPFVQLARKLYNRYSAKSIGE